MRTSVRLNDTISGLGYHVFIQGGVKSDEANQKYRELSDLASDVGRMESDLHDCVNELCLKCGCYKRSHEGACDDCRWKAVKEGFR